MNSRTRQRLVLSLGIIRISVGLSSLLWPDLAYRSLGVRLGPPDGGTIARMFGAPDAVMAAATLSSDPRVRDTGLRLGAVADGIDLGAVLAGRRNGVVSRQGVFVTGGAAAVFAVMGAAAVLSGLR